jgi:integrase
MTGHIRKRGERSWELKYSLGTDPLTGERKTRYHSFRGSKRAAEIELARLIAEHASGNGVDPTKATVGEFLATWLADWAKQNVSPLTSANYEMITRRYIVPHIGKVPIQKLRPQHLQSLYARLGRDGAGNGCPLAPRTIARVHKLLNRALGHAQTWATITTNPATVVSSPPAPHSEVQILSEEQIALLLKATEGRELRPLIVFLLGTGARRCAGPDLEGH